MGAWRFVVSYDGTDYAGFQPQPQKATVGGVIAGVLEDLLGPGQLVGASRTDAGVHAAGQVVVWRGACPIPLEKVIQVVNRRLPDAIRFHSVKPVADTWDPTRYATAKQYSYRVWRAEEPSPPWWARYTLPVQGPMNWARLVEAAQLLEGCHDFWAFRSEGSSAVTTVRRVLSSRWLIEEGGRIWRYQVVATGFLYHMVRIMVGAQLAAAASGDLGPIIQALSVPRAGKIGPPVHAKGLMLDWVRYREEG